MHWSVQIDGNPLDTLDTQETERQFLIKWKGWSHINNTWESDDSLGRYLNNWIVIFQYTILNQYVGFFK